MSGDGDNDNRPATTAAAPGKDGRHDLQALLDVMAALRTPGSGCPWDLEQNFRSIAPYTIEEAYEVAHAIDQGDMRELKEELGDLLFQVVYHAQMATEAGAFTFADVVDGITRKMIRRHPHVFGDAAAADASAVLGLWDDIKDAERAEKARTADGADGRAEASRAGGHRGEPPKAASIFDDVAVTLPGLARAMKLQKRAARVGFEWDTVDGVFRKMREEFEELAAEIEAGADKALLEGELGDILFVAANLARWIEVDAESALRGANAKFVRRFQRIEAWLAETGRTPSDSTLEEMDALWNRAKAEEREKTLAAGADDAAASGAPA